jgi:hypothetical protein
MTMGMGMLWSKLDSMRRGAVEGVGPALRPDNKAGTRSAKPMVGSAPRGDFRGAHGDTIISLPPDRYPMKALCIGNGVSEEAAHESALKLFKIRFADSDGRRRSASFLVQRRYAWRGYQVDAPADVEQGRITLSAYDGDNVVATISVGQDSASELFVNALFGHEVNSLRARGGKVCEFTKLAIEEAIKSKAVIAALFHIAYIQARRVSACTDLVVEVNPRHVRFYQRMLGFTVLGATRVDPRVDAPATLLHLDLRHAEEQIEKLGGRPELAAEVRSLYPFFFAAHEEADIERRLGAFC